MEHLNCEACLCVDPLGAFLEFGCLGGGVDCFIVGVVGVGVVVFMLNIGRGVKIRVIIQVE